MFTLFLPFRRKNIQYISTVLVKSKLSFKKKCPDDYFFFQALQKMVSVKWNVLWDSDSIEYGWVISRGYDAFEFLVAVIHTYE